MPKIPPKVPITQPSSRNPIKLIIAARSKVFKKSKVTAQRTGSAEWQKPSIGERRIYESWSIVPAGAWDVIATDSAPVP
jgi:hypothetical protein